MRPSYRDPAGRWSRRRRPRPQGRQEPQPAAEKQTSSSPCLTRATPRVTPTRHSASPATKPSPRTQKSTPLPRAPPRPPALTTIPGTPQAIPRRAEPPPATGASHLSASMTQTPHPPDPRENPQITAHRNTRVAAHACQRHATMKTANFPADSGADQQTTVIAERLPRDQKFTVTSTRTPSPRNYITRRWPQSPT